MTRRRATSLGATLALLGLALVLMACGGAATSVSVGAPQDVAGQTTRVPVEGALLPP
jgi:hypothetical protein